MVTVAERAERKLLRYVDMLFKYPNDIQISKYLNIKYIIFKYPNIQIISSLQHTDTHIILNQCYRSPCVSVKSATTLHIVIISYVFLIYEFSVGYLHFLF